MMPVIYLCFGFIICVLLLFIFVLVFFIVSRKNSFSANHGSFDKKTKGSDKPTQVDPAGKIIILVVLSTF